MELTLRSECWTTSDNKSWKTSNASRPGTYAIIQTWCEMYFRGLRGVRGVEFKKRLAKLHFNSGRHRKPAVGYSYNKSQWDAQFVKFIWWNTPQVLDRSTVYHQEFLNTVYTQQVFIMLILLAGDSRKNLHNRYLLHIYSVEMLLMIVDLSETRGIFYQINFRNCASHWLLL